MGQRKHKLVGNVCNNLNIASFQSLLSPSFKPFTFLLFCPFIVQNIFLPFYFFTLLPFKTPSACRQFSAEASLPAPPEARAYTR